MAIRYAKQFVHGCLRRRKSRSATIRAVGKTRTGSDGKAVKGRDHDPPAKEKLVPFGFLVVTTGALMLIFGLKEKSDSWADALQLWWNHVRHCFAHIKRLVIYLDNGPNNSGRRTQFLKRMVEFADWSGLTIHLVYYPPYHTASTIPSSGAGHRWSASGAECCWTMCRSCCSVLAA